MSRIRYGHPLAKAASFAVVHFSVAFSLAYLLTGSIALAGALALVEPLANTVAYYLHERAWQHAVLDWEKMAAEVGRQRKFQPLPY